MTYSHCYLQDIFVSEEENLVPQIRCYLYVKRATEEGKDPFKEEDRARYLFILEIFVEERRVDFELTPESFVCPFDIRQFKVVEIEENFHVEDVAKYFEAFFWRTAVQ